MPRYSQRYITRGARVQDSQRARLRLGAVYLELIGGLQVDHSLSTFIIGEQGCDIPYSGGVQPNFVRFFRTAEQRDVWDAITSIATFLHQNGYQPLLPRWRGRVTTILEEEHLNYRLGADWVVRPFIDGEFEANTAAALDALSQQRFSQARADFEAALRHLRDTRGLEALRMMFPSVETASKVLFPNAFATLGPPQVERYVRLGMEARYAGNEPAINAGRRLLEGFKEWINAAQQYRHGQAQEDAVEPPIDLVVAHLSAGATYLRWMIELCQNE